MNHLKLHQTFTSAGIPVNIKVPIYKFCLNLPRWIECGDCGHGHFEMVSTGFFKTGYRKVNINKLLNDHLNEQARLVFKMGTNKIYEKSKR
jgi:hypothetical protein